MSFVAGEAAGRPPAAPEPIDGGAEAQSLIESAHHGKHMFAAAARPALGWRAKRTSFGEERFDVVHRAVVGHEIAICASRQAAPMATRELPIVVSHGEGS